MAMINMRKVISFIDSAIKVTIMLGGWLAVAFIYVHSHIADVNARNNAICKQLCNEKVVYKCVSDPDKWDPPVQEAWCIDVDHRVLKK